MLKNSKRKGNAIIEYCLIACIVAMAFFWLGPRLNPLIKTYFEKSVDNNATTATNGTLTMKTMGE